MNWYLNVLKNYAVFDGRARRKEYWFFVLINLIVSTAIAMIDRQLGTFDPVQGRGFWTGLYGLFILLPTLAVIVRRLHDRDKSGWWALLLLVPVIGWFVLLVFMLLRGDSGANRFGPDPVSEH